MAVIRCPNCGKPNPEFLEVCQYCDAPLPGGGVGASAPAAGARPPHPVSSDDDTLIRPPIWSDASDKQPPAAPAPAAPDAPAEDEGEDDAPAWMARLRRRQADAADEPDWMWTGALKEPTPPTLSTLPTLSALTPPAPTPAVPTP
ncbi:MAG: hypothetical protein ABI847_17330, partial [Anaerolineales bacterium]